MKSIVIRGARENNLKDLSLEIPRDKLTVVTGLSGSGKSSLAFDTIYAEGQRRYVESLSAYLRQFLEQQGKPDVDSIDGLSPAISIEQRTLGKNPRSTVGTITEIYDYLRLLYARVGRPHCPRCGKPVSSQSVQQIVDSVLSSMPEGTRFAVLAPLCKDRKGELKKELDSLRREGFSRINLDGELRELGEELALERGKPHTIEVYVDRLALRPGIESRLTDSLELALKLGGGVVKIAPQPESAEHTAAPLLFSERLACIDCGLSLPDLTPRAFSFNNPAGACPRCSGLGVLMELEEARIVPHPELSLREGAIEPWEGRNAGYYQGVLETLAQQFGFDLFTPYAELPTSVKSLLLHGSGEIEVEFSLERGSKRSYRRPFEGVIANLQRRLEAEEQRRKEGGGAGLEGVDELIEEYHRFMRERPCPECGGARLSAEARAVTLGGRPIHALTRMAVGQSLAFFSGLALEERERRIAGRLLEEITARLSFLVSVGLDYLSLDRTSASLSGGEGQRVRLATQIGSSLTGVIYILDEPSIGLHKRDHRRLLGTLLALRDRGNTVIVVEHDEETIRAADHIVDLGPGAGTRGGELVASGTLEEIVASPRSLTGQYLSGARRIEVPRTRRKARRKLRLLGASANNLKQVDLELPLGVLCCVTGVSGSGKSTLVCDTLLPALSAALGGAAGEAGAYRSLEGASALERVIAVDQGPVGRSPRSNPATYTGIFAKIRELFAALPESKLRGYKAGRYSFNVKGGRCEACQGEGILRIAMHFLPDVFVACEVCGGKRYNRETLQVKYRGASIADLLAMTVDDALDLLGNVPPIRQKLEALRAVGLGYLTLGQGANTLSGGEAQRLKLSRELSRSGVRKDAPLPRRGQEHAQPRGGTLYVLDEPTSGLHLADIQVLLEVLEQLVDAGQSVVVIEHQLDVIKTADWVIDLGPEGGERGGRIVAAGTPEAVANTAGSFTGEYLRPVLGL